MSGRLGGISGEISAGGFRPDARHNSTSEEADAAGREVGSVHSSVEGRNETGAKGPNLNAGNSVATDEAMAPLLGIKTPLRVQALQRTLYRKAKENRRWRAWSLYGDLCRRDVLETATKAVVAHGGAAGIDGIATAQVQAGAEDFLNTLQAQLKDRSYRPGPVKRVWIPKADGQPRPLGIPNVVDRIVQMARRNGVRPLFVDSSGFGRGSCARTPPAPSTNARRSRRWMRRPLAAPGRCRVSRAHSSDGSATPRAPCLGAPAPRQAGTARPPA